MTDAAFLAALAQTPDDSALRAVYADFLDDGGRHDRAELLRADEAMRRAAVWSDEYWRLKSRRNDLRRYTCGDWLDATKCDGSRPHRLFRDGYPDAVRERWRLIRAFTEVWHEAETPDVGGHAGIIADHERRLGLTFGASLREYLAFAIDRSTVLHRGAMFRDPVRMERTPDGRALSVMVLAEGDILWAVPLDRVADDDPPVVIYMSLNETAWRATDDFGVARLSDFVFGQAIGYHRGRRFMRTVEVGSRLWTSPGWDAVAGGPDDGVMWEHASGVIVTEYTRHVPPDLRRVSVQLPPAVRWSDVPADVWAFTRGPLESHGGRMLSAEDRAALSAIFGDDPPAWYPEIVEPGNEPPF